MANDEWLRPATLVEETGAAAWHTGTPRDPMPALYDLRPLSLGEILDRTFTLYRARFWLFCGLATISGAIYLVTESAALGVQHLVRVKAGGPASVTAGLLGGYVAALIFWLASALILAATTWALAEVYLGRDASVATSLRATLGKWWRYLLITLWQGVCLVGPMLLGIIPGAVVMGVTRASSGGTATGVGLMVLFFLLGLPAGIWLYLRNALAVPVCVYERLTIRESLRRSRFLTDGVKWKLIVLGLIMAALFAVVGALEAPFSLTIFKNPLEEHIFAQAGLMLINLLGHILVAPVATIGLTLFYFDQRVRKEGFDLLVLLGQGVSATGSGGPSPFAQPGFGMAGPQALYGAPPQTAAPYAGFGPQPPQPAPYGGFPPSPVQPVSYGGFPPPQTAPVQHNGFGAAVDRAPHSMGEQAASPFASPEGAPPRDDAAAS